MDISIIVKQLPEPVGKDTHEAYAYTSGFGAKASGHSEADAIRALQKKLKEMHRFATLARAHLETKLGWHNCFIKFNKPFKKNNEN